MSVPSCTLVILYYYYYYYYYYIYTRRGRTTPTGETKTGKIGKVEKCKNQEISQKVKVLNSDKSCKIAY